MALTGASEHATGAGRCTAWASGFGGGGLGPARSRPRQCGSVGAAHGPRLGGGGGVGGDGCTSRATPGERQWRGR